MAKCAVAVVFGRIYVKKLVKNPGNAVLHKGFLAFSKGEFKCIR